MEGSDEEFSDLEDGNIIVSAIEPCSWYETLD